MIPSFRNRSHQCFVSYSHHDMAFACGLVEWLRGANIPVWQDQTNLGVGEKVASVLPEQVAKCRGMLLIASENSLSSVWVKKEIEAAVHENTLNPAFAITILRIDKVDIGRKFSALTHCKWIELTPEMSQLDTQHLVEVVNSIYQRNPTPNAGTTLDIFVSRSDRTPDESKKANHSCRQFLRHHGIQLIGDAVDQTDFSTDRIRTLMSTCSGHLMVLPTRAKEADYKYFKQEREISAALDIPCLVCMEDGSPLPQSLQQVEHLITMKSTDLVFDSDDDLIFDSFLEDVRATAPNFNSFIFFAHEYNQNRERNAAAKNLLSSVTGLNTHAGSDFTSAIGPQQIVDGISRSAWFISDLASRLNAETGRLDVNVNTCIEVGIALGAGLGQVSIQSSTGKSDRPVYALSIDRTTDPKGESSGQGKTRDIPWMLRSGITIQWYTSDSDFLAVIHRIAHAHRRRLLNTELNFHC